MVAGLTSGAGLTSSTGLTSGIGLTAGARLSGTGPYVELTPFARPASIGGLTLRFESTPYAELTTYAEPTSCAESAPCARRPRFSCEVCELSYVRERDYLRHLNEPLHRANATRKPAIQSSEFDCARCGVVCNSLDEIERHMASEQHLAFQQHSVSEVNNRTTTEPSNGLVVTNSPFSSNTLLNGQTNPLISESFKPLEPVNTFKPIKLFVPAKPLEPINPFKPVKLPELIKNFEPTRLIEPAKPSEQIKPFKLARLSEPVEPFKPAEEIGRPKKRKRTRSTKIISEQTKNPAPPEIIQQTSERSSLTEIVERAAEKFDSAETEEEPPAKKSKPIAIKKEPMGLGDDFNGEERKRSDHEVFADLCDEEPEHGRLDGDRIGGETSLSKESRVPSIREIREHTKLSPAFDDAPTTGSYDAIKHLLNRFRPSDAGVSNSLGSDSFESNDLESNGLESISLDSSGLESISLESDDLNSSGLDSNGLESNGAKLNGMQSNGLKSNSLNSKGLKSKKSDPKPPADGELEEGEIREDKPTTVHCAICDINCFSTHLDSHLYGKKHTKNLRRMGVVVANPQQQRKPPKPKPELPQLPQRPPVGLDYIKKEVVCDVVYYRCQLCRMRILGEIQFEVHARSKRHYEAVRLHERGHSAASPKSPNRSCDRPIKAQ